MRDFNQGKEENNSPTILNSRTFKFSDREQTKMDGSTEENQPCFVYGKE